MSNSKNQIIQYGKFDTDFDRTTIKMVNKLRSREVEVLYFRCLGMTYKQIAHQCYLEPSTVQVYFSSAYRILEINQKQHLRNA